MTTSSVPLDRETHHLSRQERSDRTEQLAPHVHDAPEAADHASARDELISINVGVARALAARYRGRGVALEDLEQVACEALVKAVDRFDPHRHHDLLSYAVPTIRGELQHHFRDAAWGIRPPRRLQELQARISSTTEDLSAELRRAPTREEVCAELGIDAAQHDEATGARGCFRLTSLDQPAPGSTGTVTVGDGVVDDTEPFADVETRALVSVLTRELGARDRRILRLRFVEERTQSEIAAELGISQMQVSRLLASIFARLRGQAAEQAEPVPA